MIAEAWHVAALSREAKLTPLSQLMSRVEAKPQSEADVMAKLDAWAAGVNRTAGKDGDSSS